MKVHFWKGDFLKIKQTYLVKQSVCRISISINRESVCTGRVRVTVDFLFFFLFSTQKRIASVISSTQNKFNIGDINAKSTRENTQIFVHMLSKTGQEMPCARITIGEARAQFALCTSQITCEC